VYYTYTQQSRFVAGAVADVLRSRGCEVRLASIGFTDKRWAERFSRFPLRHAILDVLRMAPAQIRGATGEIEISDPARDWRPQIEPASTRRSGPPQDHSPDRWDGQLGADDIDDAAEDLVHPNLPGGAAARRDGTPVAVTRFTTWP